MLTECGLLSDRAGDRQIDERREFGKNSFFLPLKSGGERAIAIETSEERKLSS